MSQCIHGIVSSIEDYAVARDTYDCIMAISALEHIDSEESFLHKLEEIRDGIRDGGVVCLIMNSEVRERDKETGESLMPQFEVNLPTKELQGILCRTFSGWEIIKESVRTQQYDIPRAGVLSALSTDVVTFVARK